MSQPAKVTILGYGKIAREAHGPAWQRAAAAGKATVCAIYEPTASGCTAAAAAFPHAKVIHADARAAFDSSVAADVVDICTPGQFHGELTLAALRAGSHVLVEKPLAHSAAVVDEIASSLDGLVVQVCQTLRLASPVQQFKAADRAGHLGRISRIQTVHHARHILNEAEWVIGPRGDGVLFENAIHLLDLVHYLLNLTTPISIVSSRFYETAHRPVLTGFEAFAIDEFDRHITIDFLQDSLAHSAIQSRTYVSASGADAELRFYPDGFRLLSGVIDPLHDLQAEFVRLGHLARRLVAPRRGPSPHDSLIENLLEARAGRADPLCSPASVLPAVATAEVLALAWAASRTA